MIIIDYFGFSGTGKSYLAKQISQKNIEIDSQFLLINKYTKIKRILCKIYFISFIKFKELNIILKFQRSFKFNQKKIKFKNLISFLYLLGYIKYKSKNSKIIVLDHGFFQCLLSCFVYSKNKSYSFDKIINQFKMIFSLLDENVNSYCLVLMDHNWKLIEERLFKRDGVKSKYLINESNIKLYENSLKNCEKIYKNLPKKKFSLFFSRSFHNDNYKNLNILLKKHYG